MRETDCLAGPDGERCGFVRASSAVSGLRSRTRLSTSGRSAPLMEKTLGISARRTLPHYARERFDKWFVRRGKRGNGRARGKVILWDDTFVRYHEPHIGIAAVAVLEALGFEVILPSDRKCCGRPAFSQGNLREADPPRPAQSGTLGSRHGDDAPSCSSSRPVTRCSPKIIAS